MKNRVGLLTSKLVLGLLMVLHGQSAFAAYAGKDSVQGYLVLIMLFINNVILPLLFSIALLFFLINALRYFVIGGGDTDSQAEAKLMALYGIGAFVFLVSIWGIVNMIVAGLQITNTRAECPDYFENFGGRCGSSGFGNGTFLNATFEAYLNIEL